MKEEFSLDEIKSKLNSNDNSISNEELLDLLDLNLRYSYFDPDAWNKKLSSRANNLTLAEINFILQLFSSYSYPYQKNFQALINFLAHESIIKLELSPLEDVIENIFQLSNLNYHDEEFYFYRWKTAKILLLKNIKILDENLSLKIIKALTKLSYNDDLLINSIKEIEISSLKNKLSLLFYLTEYTELIANNEYRHKFKSFIIEEISKIDLNDNFDIFDKTKLYMIYKAYSQELDNLFSQEFLHSLSTEILSIHSPKFSPIQKIVNDFINQELKITTFEEGNILGYTTSDIIIFTPENKKIIIEIDGKTHQYLGKELVNTRTKFRNFILKKQQDIEKIITITTDEIITNRFRIILEQELSALTNNQKELPEEISTSNEKAIIFPHGKRIKDIKGAKNKKSKKVDSINLFSPDENDVRIILSKAEKIKNIDEIENLEDLRNTILVIYNYRNFRELNFQEKTLIKVFYNLLQYISDDSETNALSIIAIINHPMLLEKKNKFIEDALFNSIALGKKNLLSLLIAFFTPVLDIFDQANYSLLQAAVNANYKYAYEMVEILLENGANPNIISYKLIKQYGSIGSNSTVYLIPDIQLPIFDVIMLNKVELFRLFIKFNANLMLYSERTGINIMNVLASATSMEIFTAFIKLAKVNKDLLIERSINNQQSHTILYSLARYLTIKEYQPLYNNIKEKIQILIDLGTDPNISSVGKKSKKDPNFLPQHIIEILANAADVNIAAELIEYIVMKSPFEIKKSKNYTSRNAVLLLLAINKLDHVFEKLLNYDYFNPKDFLEGLDPIITSISAQNNYIYFDRLLQKYPDQVDHTNQFGQSALMFTIINGNYHGTIKLINFRANPHLISTSYFTPYAAAHIIGDEHIIVTIRNYLPTHELTILYDKLFSLMGKENINFLKINYLEMFKILSQARMNDPIDLPSLMEVAKQVKNRIDPEKFNELINTAKLIEQKYFAILESKPVEELLPMQQQQLEKYKAYNKRNNLEVRSLYYQYINPNVSNIFANMHKLSPALDPIIPVIPKLDFFLENKTKPVAVNNSNITIGKDNWLKEPEMNKLLSAIGPLNTQKINSIALAKTGKHVKAVKYNFKSPDGNKETYIYSFNDNNKVSWINDYLNEIKTTYLRYNPLQPIFQDSSFIPKLANENKEVIISIDENGISLQEDVVVANDSYNTAICSLITILGLYSSFDSTT
jgi:very-short-patch-repair endonuclease